MNFSGYEEVTSKIAASVFERVSGFPAGRVLFGKKNKWSGQSGYPHQIDVAICGSQDIIMVECKHYNKKNRVKVEHLLTFSGRINDIRPIHSETIHPVIVTLHGFQSGCQELADYYKIDLAI